MKRGPEPIRRRPDHGAPIVDPRWPVILEEARRDLARREGHRSILNPLMCRADDPTELPTFAPAFRRGRSSERNAT